MNNEKLFDLFKKEIENIDCKPCDKPYDISCYLDKKTKRILSDIDNNHNHSWIKEVWDRNKNTLDYTAITYRGQKISYRDFFEQAYKYAIALSNTGFNKDSELLCVIENTPEFPVIMGAVSILGGKVNLVSSEFDEDYLIEMANRSNFPYVFVSDMSFAKFSTILNNEKCKKRGVIIPLDHSLPNGNPYKDITECHYKLDEESYRKAQEKCDCWEDIDEFLTKNSNYKKDIMVPSDLNDEYTITYTSGSTGWGKPKALIHKVRSYITMGRYHDPEASGIPSMKQKTTLALIKTMSDTDFMTNISDTFMQSGIVALEPINNKEYFLSSILINKPTYAIASRSYWLYAMKQQMNSPEFKNIKLPFLLVPTAVGEPMSANEEKALNRWLKSLKTGVDITKVPIVCMCTGGGDSEHGGLFITIFRALQSKRPSHIGINEPIGMQTYGMVQVQALRKDGSHCDTMECGQLVANSPCNMKGYVNNDKANKEFFIKDKNGKEWGNLDTYGYIDKQGNIYVKGRIGKNDPMIPTYCVADVILKDTKKIMSCEVVSVFENGKHSYVAHIEPQMDVSFDKDKVLSSAMKRCIKAFGEEFTANIYFRVRSNEESFNLLHTGKRNNIALVNEGISEKCINAMDIQKNQVPKIILKKN